MSHVAVIGAGAWGTALSLLLASRQNAVKLWTWEAEHAVEMERARENARFFPGFPLDAAIAATSDLGAAVAGAELVVIVVPTFAYRATVTRLAPYLAAQALLVSATKGIEEESLALPSEILAEVLEPSVARRAVVLSGPSFAGEVAKGLPTNVVAASVDASRAAAVQERMATSRFRIYTSEDPIGVEVGGALKNVIAIAVGACGALGFGHNTRAALITRGLAEMSRLAQAKGGSVLTLAGLSGLGDLVLTCTGELSRNRTVGHEIGLGKPLAEVLQQLGHVAEGVPTAASAYHLANRLGVDLPITQEVYRVLHEGKKPVDAVRDILARPLKSER
jgi:glycerol-3-phosphate dehydrogenase (NAD(P)+)